MFCPLFKTQPFIGKEHHKSSKVKCLQFISCLFSSEPNRVQLRSPEPGAVNTSFDVSWELSSDNVDQYLLQVYNYYDNGNVYAEYFTKTTDNTRIEGIPPGTHVIVSISAVIGSGDMRQEGAISFFITPGRHTVVRLVLSIRIFA